MINNTSSISNAKSTGEKQKNHINAQQSPKKTLANNLTNLPKVSFSRGIIPFQLQVHQKANLAQRLAFGSNKVTSVSLHSVSHQLTCISFN